MKKRIAAIFLLTLAACDTLPRDPEGTVDRIRQSHILAIGVASPFIPPEAAQLIRALARENGARAVVRHGTLEPLIVDLDAGRLDMVIAQQAKRTPWKTLVAPGPSLSARGTGRDRLEWRALMKNGENRWIMQVEATSRRVAPENS